MKQDLFDFDEPAEDATDVLAPTPRVSPPVAPAVFYPRQGPVTIKQQFIEQIARDTRVLQEDPVYWVPSREFYEQRIADNRAFVLEHLCPTEP